MTATKPAPTLPADIIAARRAEVAFREFAVCVAVETWRDSLADLRELLADAEVGTTERMGYLALTAVLEKLPAVDAARRALRTTPGARAEW